MSEKYDEKKYKEWGYRVNHRLEELEKKFEDNNTYNLALEADANTNKNEKEIAELRDIVEGNVSDIINLIHPELDEVKEEIDHLKQCDIQDTKNYLELKERFNEREKHQFQDYFKLQRFEKVLREHLEEHYNIADCDRDDEDIIQFWKKSLRVHLRKLGGSEKKEIIGRCYECGEESTETYGFYICDEWSKLDKNNKDSGGGVRD